MPTENIARLRHTLQQNQLDGALLTSPTNFAWATDGASNYVNIASSVGAAALLVTADRAVVLTDTIEAPRLQAEEPTLQTMEFAVGPWHAPNPALPTLTAGLRLGVDHPSPAGTDISATLTHLRAHLTPAEGQRFQELGRRCATAMGQTIAAIRPGQSEHHIAAILAAETMAQGALPIVTLVAVDDRALRYRHPLPTTQLLAHYALLVLCARWQGLVCSISRQLHFGPLPADLRHKQTACAHVDATLIQATRPGTPLRDILTRGIQAYAQTGYPDEWQKHHQGGVAGYEPREIVATPASQAIVAPGQVFAWNPTIQGTKSEDTILVSAHQNEILTTIPGWPTIATPSLPRPAILEIT